MHSDPPVPGGGPMRTAGRVALALAAAGLALSWAVAESPVHFVVNLGSAYLLAWGAALVLSPTPRAEILRRFVLASCALALTVGLLEIPAAVGLVDYREVLRTPILAPWRNPRYRMDRELIYARPPHQHLQGSFRGGDFTYLYEAEEAEVHDYDVRYDRHGHRNPDDMERAGIAVLGDSFVEGSYVSDAELVTSRLAGLTGKTVANLALIGYGPRQELVLLRRHALPLAARTVVWVFFEGNDLKNIHDYDDTAPRLEEAYAGYHSFVPRSFTKNALMAVMRLVGQPRPSGRPRSGLVPDGEARQRVYFLYPGEPLGPDEKDALGELQRILATAGEVCRDAGVELVLAFAPTKFRVYEGLVDVEPGSELAGWRSNDLPARLRAVLAAAAPDSRFVDLTPGLREAAAAGRRPFFVADSHWTPEGHRVVAEVLAGALGFGSPGASPP